MNVRACIDIFDISICALGLYSAAQRESIIENSGKYDVLPEQNKMLGMPTENRKQVGPRLKSDFLCSSDSCASLDSFS